MADKPIENLIYEFLDEKKADLPADSVVMPSAYDKRDGDHGVTVGDADSSMLPNGNDLDMTEFDSLVTLEIFARVTGQDKTLRLPARQKVFDIKKKIIQLFEEYPTLDGRGCKVRLLRQNRFFDDTRADKWATEWVPIVINPMNFGGE